MALFGLVLHSRNENVIAMTNKTVNYHQNQELLHVHLGKHKGRNVGKDNAEQQMIHFTRQNLSGTKS